MPCHDVADECALPPESLAADRWPTVLQTTLGILLASQQPMLMFWGPEHRCFCNDAYLQTIDPAQAVELTKDRPWRELWQIIGPRVVEVMRGNGPARHENQYVPHGRHGGRDDAYWTYSYNPVPDAESPSGVGGVLVIGTDTTDHVITEQRQAFLIDLDEALREQNDARRIVATAIDSLGRHLQVSRVGFGRVCSNGEDVVLETNYTDGVEPLIGTYPLAAFGAHNLLRARSGETVVWNDVELDLTCNPELWHSIDTRAVVTASLVREGCFRAGLFVNHRHPRVWSAYEVTLIERVSARIWDAVERVQAEAQLLLTNQRVELALQGSFVTLAYQNLELRYTWLYNRGLEFTQFDAIGRTDADLFPAEEAAVLVALKRDAMNSRQRRRQVVSVTAQGVRRHFDLFVEPIIGEDDAIEGVRCASFDITDLKQTEMALRASEARLKLAEERLTSLADAVPQLVWIGRSDGELEYVNRRLCDYTGLSERDAMRRDTMAEIIHPQDRDSSTAAWMQGVQRGESYTLEHRLRRHDGVYRWFLVRAQPERDAAGQILRWYGTSTDIDEVKQLQAHLVATQAALRDTDARKDLFLATLSHELRNPLAPIRNAAQILDSPGVAPHHLQWARSVIQRQVKHMALLLDDLLDVARITRGKLDLKRTPAALTHIVDTAVEAARPQIDDKNHHLTINLPSATPILLADPLRLSQVLSNLLTNAAKYTDPGGHIELSARVAGGIAHISVKDDGIGIPPEFIERIFDMFSQVDGRSAHSDGGLGIGLALVKGLIELHGGTVSAHSAGLGRGSEFTVSLPLGATGQDGGQVEHSEPETSAATGRRVLIADDNKDAADSLAMLIQIAGHEVRVAYTGAAALSLAQAFRPDIALLDIGMPDMSGYDVAAELRALAWGGDIHLVALTGWGQERDRERSARAGFNRHVTKPIDADTLDTLLGDTRPS